MNAIDTTTMNERILDRPGRVCLRPRTRSHPSMLLHTLQFFHDPYHQGL
jgi:hypothetical protein